MGHFILMLIITEEGEALMLSTCCPPWCSAQECFQSDMIETVENEFFCHCELQVEEQSKLRISNPENLENQLPHKN